MTVVIQGNALCLPLADDSVDLIITSPPYYALRSYRDDGAHYDGQLGSEPTPQAFLEALWAVTAECWRVLKPSGSLFVNLGDKRAGSGGHNNGAYGTSGLHKNRPNSSSRDAGREHRASLRNAPDRYQQAAFGRTKSKMLLPHRYAIGCEDGLADPDGVGWIVRSDMVWSKPNGLPESVRDRVRDSHEYWFHLTKRGDYYAAVDEVREAQQTNGERHEGRSGYVNAADAGEDDIARSFSTRSLNPLGKLPGSVWTIEEDVWEQLSAGPFDFCPRCGRDIRTNVGRGSPIRTLPVTDVSLSPAAASSTSTASPTSSPTVPSPTASPSTTCAATEDAATPPISKPSPAPTTSGAVASPSKPIASTATASPTPTSTAAPVASPASAAPATSSVCVCAMLDSRPNGPGSVWSVPSEPLRVPAFVGVDHFAAFPQEIPRRLILGWSPSGICTVCGEGRRPVVDSRYLSPTSRPGLETSETGRHRTHLRMGDGVDVSIVGYACACTPHTDHPENRLTSWHDHSDNELVGRQGGAALRNKRYREGLPPPVREYHLAGWTPPPTRPAVVLDPFGGTGTVAMVARALGRVGVNVDLSADYCRLARWRIFQSGHAAKTVERTHRANQGTLL